MRRARITTATVVIGLAVITLCDSSIGQSFRNAGIEPRLEYGPPPRSSNGFIPEHLAQELNYPNVVGIWTGIDWGQVELREVETGVVEGTYSDTFGTAPGEINLKFNDRSRRFDGIWREGKYRHGRISIRLSNDRKSVRGAWTTDESCEHDPGFPALADLEWAPVIPKPAKNAPQEAATTTPPEQLKSR